MDKVYLAEVDKLHPVELLDGLLLRRTMSYNKDIMLCHFTLKKGLTMPRHQHAAVQIGYVLEDCEFIECFSPSRPEYM